MSDNERRSTFVHISSQAPNANSHLFLSGKDGISFLLKMHPAFIQLESLMKNLVCSVKSALSILI